MASGCLAAGPPASADEIMAKVAVNQDRAERARADFVYRQNIVVRLRDTHGKLVREEISDYQVIPDEQRTHKELIKFAGRYRRGGAMLSYGKSGEGLEGGFRYEADGHMAKNLREGLINDRKSKDGVSAELFPLTAREQRKYHFILKGEETYQGTGVYRIAFEPNKSDDETCWKGEALISQADFEPLVVTTRLAPAIPFLVRTALGTNVQGLGFSVQYRKFADGVWFPLSYGTEFWVRALFLYSRQITISMVNSDFRRADVKTSVEFDTLQ